MTPALLVVVAVGFAWSMGAHYTGACMGMPYSLRVVGARQALLIMAPLALVGAAFASHGVERTVAHRLTTTAPGTGAEVVIVAVAFALTTIYNRLKVPTSTIQILVFSVVGTSLGAGLGVRWTTIGTLAIVWVLAPVVAAGLGYVLTRLLSSVGAALPAAWGRLSWPLLGAGLVVVGGAASFTMGGNDVANATGALVAVHAFSPLTAGAVGGAGLASGVLTYGRKLLDRVAFEIVELDRAMATAAQAV
ncbi:MAG: inorganic phosphate transporter, partial [Acidimicrobiales bacterium]